jgi:hypothetical protein
MRTHENVIGVAAVGVGAVDQVAAQAELAIANAAILALAAAAVVVDHDAAADRRFLVADGCAV